MDDAAAETPENKQKWIRFLKRTAVQYLLSAAKIDDVGYLFNAHIIQFREDGWTIRHPIQERIEGDLFNCQYNRFDYPDWGDLRGFFWIGEDGSLRATVSEEEVRKLV